MRLQRQLILIRAPFIRRFQLRACLAAKIAALAGNPRPADGEKLSAQEQYRVRQGRHRVVYSIADAEKTVLVVKVAHRREV
ncbi:MAG: type II toxin-antitoxin system RelE/ParE family toxin [Terriglobia bacterium]